jgi:hypothetical protein
MAQQESATDDVFNDIIDSCLKEIPKVGKPGDPRPILTDDDEEDKFGLSYKAIGKRAAGMKSLADLAKDALEIKPVIDYDSPEDYAAGRPVGATKTKECSEGDTEESLDRRSTRVATVLKGTPKPAQTAAPDTTSNEGHAQEFVGLAYAGHSATQKKADHLNGLPHAQRHDIARRVRDMKGMMPTGAPPKAEHAQVLNKFLSDHGF